MVMTKPAYFVIQQGSVAKGSVRLRVDSNLNLPFQCLLFNSQGLQVGNNTYSPRTTDCLFVVNEKQLVFRAQCMASHRNGQSTISRSVSSSFCKDQHHSGRVRGLYVDSSYDRNSHCSHPGSCRCCGDSMEVAFRSCADS